MGKDTRPWITVCAEYEGAFAWFCEPCDESELDGYIGSNCGDLYTQKRRGIFEEEELPRWLAERFCKWIIKWQEIDKRNDATGNDFNRDYATEEEMAVDDEGVELTKELKKLYGDKYRFRYSYAWRWRFPSEKGWVIV